jgi:multiple sugar transport system substrate-binding protein
VVKPSHRRRLLRTLAAFAVLVGLLTGCVDLPTFMPEPEITLRLAVPDALQAGYLTEQVRAFEQDNPTIKVTIFSRLSAMRGTSLATAISTLATTTEGLDLIYLTDADFRTLGNPDVLTDLSPYIRESQSLLPGDFYPAALPVFQSRGRQMVLPTEVVPLVMFYNRDLFDKMKVAYPNPDWTTAEFQATAKAFAAKNTGTGDIVGFVSDPMTAIWPFFLAYGAEFPDAERDPSAKAITSPAAIHALQWFADLSVRDNVTPNPPTSRQLSFWYSGKAAMTALYMSARNSVPNQGPRTDATPTPGPRQTWAFRWDVAPMPRAERSATVVYVAGLAIPKGAKNPNEAWMLSRYLARTLPAQGGSSSYVPAVKSLANSPEFSALYVESGRRAYVDSVDHGQTLPMLPPGAQVSEQDLSPVLRGEMSADQGLQRLRERLGPALENWARSRQ